MVNSLDAIPVLPSLAPLIDKYDAWLCDIWGVLHNGEQPFAGAVDACIRYRAQGGVVILVSNSPRPCHGVARQLAEIGVPTDCYDAIVTSGDTTRQALEARKGMALFHLGPGRDKPLLEGLDVRVTDLEQAEYVLCTGLYDDETETPEDYADMLGRMRERDLLMICANPDIQVERGNKLAYCAGALAAAYADLGGEVLYTGKPHPPIYDRACEFVRDTKGGEVPRARILCIGDGILTDIAGAASAGMDAVYVASGLHINGDNGNGSLNPDELETAFADDRPRPIAAQSRLSW